MVRKTLLVCLDFCFSLPLLVSGQPHRIRSRPLNVNRGVTGASDLRSNIQCHQQLALCNRILRDSAGGGSYRLIVWCVEHFTFCKIVPDRRMTIHQRGSRESPRCSKFTRMCENAVPVIVGGSQSCSRTYRPKARGGYQYIVSYSPPRIGVIERKTSGAGTEGHLLGNDVLCTYRYERL